MRSSIKSSTDGTLTMCKVAVDLIARMSDVPQV